MNNRQFEHALEAIVGEAMIDERVEPQDVAASLLVHAVAVSKSSSTMTLEHWLEGCREVWERVEVEPLEP